MISAPIQASPVVVQPTLGTDLAAAVLATVDANELQKYGLTPAQVAGIYQGAANKIAVNTDGSFKPLGVVRADQTSTAATKPTIDLSYYNIEEIAYGGVDFGAEYSFNNSLSAFGSISWLSNNLFTNVAVGKGENAPKTNFSLNVPDTKVKLGMDYHPRFGFNGSLSMRYQNDWEAINGTLFTGHVDAFTNVDLGVGYTFKKGVSISATCTNLFKEDYRFIYGAPIIGRQLLARVVYTLNHHNSK